VSIDTDPVFEEAVSEYLDVRDRGENPGLSHFLTQYPPDVADRVRAFVDDYMATVLLMLSERNAPAWLEDFGHYRNIVQIGRGGQGVVFRADDISFRRPVALKILFPGRGCEADDLRRFRDEIRNHRASQHPNIVPLYNTGRHRGYLYFTMQYMPRGSLAELKSPSRSGEKAARLLATLARAIQHAHSWGVFHFDLKPSNVLLDAKEIPYVSDFGLAHYLQPGLVTTPSMQAGTPAYVAPEQLEESLFRNPAAIDVYGLGTILYFLLAARPPFRAETRGELADRIVTQRPDSPRRFNRKADRDIEAICLKCLEKNPDRRYSSAEELVRELDYYTQGRRLRARWMGSPNRAARWVRRHPERTALLTGCLVMVTLTAVAVRYDRELRELQTERMATQSMERRMRRSAIQQDLRLADRGRRIGDPWWARELFSREPESAAADGGAAFVWGLLDRATRVTAPTLLEGRAGEPEDIAFAPDGQSIAVASRDGAVRLWDVGRRRLRATLTGHTGPARVVTFLPDRQRLASVGDDHKVRIWDARDGSEVDIRSYAFTAADQVALGGQILVILGSEGGEKGSPGLFRFDLVKQDQTVRICNTGKDARLLRCSADGTVAVWVQDDGKRIVVHGGVTHTESKLSSPARSLAASDDGRVVAVAEANGSLQVWERDFARWDHLPLDVGEVNAMAISPRGSTVATTGDNATISLWGRSSGRLRAALRAQEAVRCLAFAPGGRLLAAASRGGSVLLWDLEPRPAYEALASPALPSGPVAVSPDGEQLAMAAQDRTVRLIDVATWQERRRLDGALGEIRSLAFAPDGGSLAVRDENLIRIWDSHTGELAGPLVRHPGVCSCFAFSPDGRLATGAEDSIVRLWDTHTGKELAQIGGHGAAVRALLFSPNGLLASVDAVGTASLWDLEHGAFNQARSLKLPSPGVTAAFSHKGDVLAVAGEDGDVTLWTTADGSVRGGHREHTGRINALAFTFDDRELVSAGTDGSLRSWDLIERRLRHQVDGAHAGEILSVVSSPNDPWIASCGRDGTLKVWTRNLWNLQSSLGRLAGEFRVLSFSQDGSTLFTGATGPSLSARNYPFAGRNWYNLQRVAGPVDNEVLGWDVTSSASTRRVRGQPLTPLTCMAASYDGRAIAEGTAGGVVFVWDSNLDEPRFRFALSDNSARYYSGLSLIKGVFPIFPNFTSNVRAVALAPDRTTVATADDLGQIRLWDLPTAGAPKAGNALWPPPGGEPTTLTQGSGPVTSLLFSHSGNVLAAIIQHRLWFWTKSSGQWEHDGRAVGTADERIFCAAWSPDDETVAVGNADGVITFWTPGDDGPHTPLIGHSGGVRIVAFSPDGQLLASGGDDSQIKIWNVATGNELATLDGHHGPVLGLSFSPDGSTLASGTGGASRGELYLWRSRDTTRHPASVIRPR
jgi:eukaryotic-like serine/threonine-protein kinase